jgi:opacity protein-like surface antigen
VTRRGRADAATTAGATTAAAADRDRPLPSYRVHVYRDTGKVLSIGGTTHPVLSYQTSFGYNVTHQGEVEGWRHEIEGAGLVKLAPNWYRIQVPNGGEVPVTTKIEAVEPGGTMGPLSLSLHVGGNLPVGQSGRYSGGPGGGIDLEYRLNATFAVEAFLGLDDLRGKAGAADLRVTQLHVSGKVYLLPGTIRPFALAGAGGYGLDPGSWKAGVHAGGGVQVNLWPRFAVEATAKYHDVPGPTPALRFVTLQAGARLRF